MKIALVYLGRRGAGGGISLRLAQPLAKRHQVVTYVSGTSENLKEWRSAHVDHHQVQTYGSWLEALATLLFPVQIQRLVNSIYELSPDVLLFPMFHPWNAYIQQALHHIPSVVYVHDPEPHPDIQGWFYGNLEDRSIRQAKRCVILSSATKPALLKRGVHADNMDVIPLGSLWTPQSVMTRHELRQIPVLLFFGRIVPYKGLETLLAAYALLRKRMECRLLIVGEGRLGWKFKKLLDQDGVSVINCWVSEGEIEGYFLESDVVVLPYTSATQSGVIPIAASFGMPVVASSVGGLVEQVEDGVSGWLVPPADPVALAQTLCEVLSDQHQARRRGYALQGRYQNEFSWERHASLLEESMRRACKP